MRILWRADRSVPGVVNVGVIDPAHPFAIELSFTMHGNEPELIGVSVERRMAGEPLTIIEVHRLPLEAYVSYAATDLRSRAAAHAHQQTDVVRAPEDRTGDVDDGVPGTNRLSALDVDLALVAETYRSALSSEHPRTQRAPVAAVARQLSIDRVRAGRYVRQARGAGLLEPPDDRFRSFR